MTQQHGNKNERSCQLKCYNLIITKVRRMKDSIKQNITIIRIIKKKDLVKWDAIIQKLIGTISWNKSNWIGLLMAQ